MDRAFPLIAIAVFALATGFFLVAVERDGPEIQANQETETSPQD